MVENYLRHQNFPDAISKKGDEAYLGRACKKFSVANGQLMYKGNRLMVTGKQRKINIIHDVHQLLGNNVKALLPTKRYRMNFIGILSSAMWQSISKAAIIARNIS